MKLFMVGFLLFATSAFADVADDLEACMKKATTLEAKRVCGEACSTAATSTVEMKLCTYAQADIEQREYNRAITAITKTLTAQAESKDEYQAREAKEQLTRLKAYAKSFEAGLEPKCNFAGLEMLFGTGENLAIGSCKLDEYKNAADLIKRLLEQ